MGLDPIFRNDSGFDPGCFVWYSEQALESLIRQVAGGGDTKAGVLSRNGQRSGDGDTKPAGIIPQWLERFDLGLWAIRFDLTRMSEI